MNKISIVFTARNDNYGGDLLARIDALFRALIYATNRVKSKIELIIVEYNPPIDKRRLHEVLRIPKSRYITVRFIEYPPEYHIAFPNSSKIKLFEYSAKNIGIRRANGDYIISTNQDIIFTPEFIEYVCKKHLDRNVFYRTNRIDVHFSKEIFYKDIRTILRYCKTNKYLEKRQTGDHFLRLTPQTVFATMKNYIYMFLYTIKRIFTLNYINLEHKLHTYAAGDFLMMHKSAWDKVGGYDETKKGNDFLDGYILFFAHCLGLRQTIIPEELYHIDHLMSKAGRPSVSLAQYERDYAHMIKTGKPYRKRQENWGEKGKKLKETVLFP